MGNNMDINLLMTNICRSEFALIYVHSLVKPLRKGALSSFKKIYIRIENNKKLKLNHIYVIQPSLLLKTRIFMVERCVNRNLHTVFEKLEPFDK